MIDFAEELRLMNDNFNSARENLVLNDSQKKYAKKQIMPQVIDEINTLESFGKVHWGSIIIADANIYEPFPWEDYHALITYSVDRESDEDKDIDSKLLSLARHIVGQDSSKDRTKDDEVVTQVLDLMQNDIARVFGAYYGCDFPDRHFNYFLTSCMIFREHIAGGIFYNPILPVIACPEKSKAVMILPCSYWTENFTEYWRPQAKHIPKVTEKQGFFKRLFGNKE
jgi:hypothetical protein